MSLSFDFFLQLQNSNCQTLENPSISYENRLMILAIGILRKKRCIPVFEFLFFKNREWHAFFKRKVFLLPSSKFCSAGKTFSVGIAVRKPTNMTVNRRKPTNIEFSIFIFCSCHWLNDERDSFKYLTDTE